MTAEPIDGVVKYQASHTRGDVETSLRTLPAGIRETALDALTLFPELDAARTTLHDAGLIGVYPSGIGYGNVSLRLAGNLFLISGSGTGSSRLLGKQGYSLVRAFDPLENTVASFGPVQASSESMTHGAVYGAANKARVSSTSTAHSSLRPCWRKASPGLRNPSPTEPPPFPAKWHADHGRAFFFRRNLCNGRA